MHDACWRRRFFLSRTLDDLSSCQHIRTSTRDILHELPPALSPRTERSIPATPLACPIIISPPPKKTFSPKLEQSFCLYKMMIIIVDRSSLLLMDLISYWLSIFCSPPATIDGSIDARRKKNFSSPPPPPPTTTPPSSFSYSFPSSTSRLTGKNPVIGQNTDQFNWPIIVHLDNWTRTSFSFVTRTLLNQAVYPP